MPPSILRTLSNMSPRDGPVTILLSTCVAEINHEYNYPSNPLAAVFVLPGGVCHTSSSA